MVRQAFPAFEALKAGDEAAWSAAFPHLWSIALHVAQHCGAQITLSEAEDVVVESIRLAIHRIETVPSAEALRGLVCAITRRRAISLARQKSALKRIPKAMLTTASGPIEMSASPEPVDEKDPLVALQTGELVALMRQALMGLDTSTQELLYEKFALGMTYEELSAKHRLPLGTLCSKVARGLEKVRVALSESPELMKELKSFLR